MRVNGLTNNFRSDIIKEYEMIAKRSAKRTERNIIYVKVFEMA